MKKTLIAISVAVLLAAPSQMASAASNTSEDTSYKKETYSKWFSTKKIEKAQSYKVIEITNKSSKVTKNAQKQVTVPSTKATKTVEKKVTVPSTKATKTVEKKVTVPSTKAKTVEKVVTAPTTEAKTVEKATTTPTTEVTTQKEKEASTTAVPGIHAYEQQVLDLTNVERAKEGLAALKADTALMAAAREKSVDMQKNNYFSHTSPTFGSPFDRMKALGIQYKSAGENIAQGQSTPAQVVEAWMNSEGHRANIMSSKFTHLGVGYVANGNYWTQQFVGR